MKRCPQCRKTYDDAAILCQYDGSPLLTTTSFDSQADTLKSSSQDDILRDEREIEHLRQQIEELYAPLCGLIQQVRNHHETFREIAITDQGEVTLEQLSKTQQEVWYYLAENYLLPLNSKMAELIRTKMHLLASDELPKSFKEFLEFESRFAFLHGLDRDKAIKVNISTKIGWPLTFESDIEDTLQKLKVRYNKHLKS
jgi:hypothetical protein